MADKIALSGCRVLDWLRNSEYGSWALVFPERRNFLGEFCMHRIRLRKPWQLSVGGQSDGQRVGVPHAVNPTGDEDHRDRVYTRHFNCNPQLLTSKVLLRVSDWKGSMKSVELNGQLLLNDHQGGEGLLVELTGVLKPHNCLELSLSRQESVGPCLSGDVDLLISDD